MGCIPMKTRRRKSPETRFQKVWVVKRNRSLTPMYPKSVDLDFKRSPAAIETAVHLLRRKEGAIAEPLTFAFGAEFGVAERQKAERGPERERRRGNSEWAMETGESHWTSRGETDEGKATDLVLELS